MENLSKEWNEFTSLVNKKRNRITKLNLELKELLDNCQHEEIEAKSLYYPGGYLDTDSTDYWNECMLCHARSNVTTVNHGHYG